LRTINALLAAGMGLLMIASTGCAPCQEGVWCWKDNVYAVATIAGSAADVYGAVHGATQHQGLDLSDTSPSPAYCEQVRNRIEGEMALRVGSATPGLMKQSLADYGCQ
jgi:hypothetical protein